MARGHRRRWVLMTLLTLVLVVALALAVGALVVRTRASASLPPLDGRLVLPDLHAPVTIERDAAGVVTLRGTRRDDVAFATGFVHAGERFFQMDLFRRRAAGELAALVGAPAVPLDEASRVHRFRERARKVLARLDARQRTLFEAYARGVNAGLGALGAPPPEYLLLGETPEPWRLSDTVLVVASMYQLLQDDTGRIERARAAIHACFPGAAEFLDPPGTIWDAPVRGPALAATEIPGPGVVDLRASQEAAADVSRREAWRAGDGPELALGSNAWAVAGTRTADGRALLANDMHLPIDVPNTWYRVRLVVEEEGGAVTLDATGVTLPGVPAIVVGSTRDIAWGFTNSYADFSDVVLVELDPQDPERYLTPTGLRRFEIAEHVIEVAGGPSRRREVRETIWGPVMGQDERGRPWVLRWVAHDPAAIDAGILGFERARSVEDALDVAAASGMPGQNLLVADAGGRIAWTIMGPLPARAGHDGRLPSSWADGTRGWQGFLPRDERPSIVDPTEGLLWTANARVVSGEALAKLGDGGYALGARAAQIRDALRARERHDEASLLAIQLDDRALFYERWRDLLLKRLAGGALAGHPERDALQRFVERWGARASVDSVGFRVVRAFRLFVHRQLLGGIYAACEEREGWMRPTRLRQSEGPVWALVSERPAHWLPPAFESFEALLDEAAAMVLDELLDEGEPLASKTWGARNTFGPRHPLSQALPFLGRYLDMPPRPLPGAAHMPRVQGLSAGASQRLVVAPDHADDGIFHMPCGQSGHPLSPHYRAGHDAWAEGRATPLLPGAEEHALTLLPSPSRPAKEAP